MATTVRGVRLTPEQHKKWAMLAKLLKVNQNQVIGLLIDSARVKAPKIDVVLSEPTPVEQAAESTDQKQPVQS